MRVVQRRSATWRQFGTLVLAGLALMAALAALRTCTGPRPTTWLVVVTAPAAAGGRLPLANTRVVVENTGLTSPFIGDRRWEVLTDTAGEARFTLGRDIYRVIVPCDVTATVDPCTYGSQRLLDGRTVAAIGGAAVPAGDEMRVSIDLGALP